MSNKANRTRSIRIEFFVDEKEKELILEKAKNFTSLSEYLRKIAIKGKVILPAPSIDRETQMQLARLGNNINQIIHALHKAEMNILNKSIRNNLIENVEGLKALLDKNSKKLDQILGDI